MTVPSQDAAERAAAPTNVPAFVPPDVNPQKGPAPASQSSSADPANPGAPQGFDLSSLFQSSEAESPGGDEVEEEFEEEQNVPTPQSASNPTPAPAPSPQDAQLQEQNRIQTQLAQAVAALAGKVNAPQPAPTPTQPEAPKVWLRAEQIPQPMVAMLNSEDPAERLNGLAAFGDALVRMVYGQVQKDVNETYTPRFEEYVRNHQNEQQRVTAFRQEFSTKYPVLVQTDAGRLVAQHAIGQAHQRLVAAGVAVDQAGWGNPKFEDEFKKVLTELKVPFGGSTTPQPQPAPTPAPRVSRQSGGARPAALSGGGNTQAEQMASVLATARMGPR